MQNKLDKLKRIAKWVGIALGVLILIIPWILAYYFYRKQGKKVYLWPEFKVVDINSVGDDLDKDILKSAARTGQEILQRMGAQRNGKASK